MTVCRNHLLRAKEGQDTHMKNKTVQRELTIRKQPSQDRSKEKVQRILEATIRLLETGGFEGLTTNHIAREADMSVASLYQYFPNKHGVIYAVYQQWLKSVIAAFDNVEQTYLLKLTWEDFFNQLILNTFATPIIGAKAEIQLSIAIEASPDLKALDNEFGKEVAARLARYLKAYGAKWPMARLKNLGLLLYDFSIFMARRAGSFSGQESNQELRWAKAMTLSLLQQCFEEEK